MSFLSFLVKEEARSLYMVTGFSNVDSNSFIPRANIPTDDNEINNNNFQLPIIQYVPATVLNTLSALAHLILTNAQDRYCYYNHFTIEELRIREEK